MARAFDIPPRPLHGAAPMSHAAAPAHAPPPARTFAQLAGRLHLGAAMQRRVAEGPADDVSRIRGPGRAPTGLPMGLRADVEARSSVPLGDVRVHRDSPEPARVGALAYAQGRDIHLGPQQERHLPHEAWHVVQQKQGRVRPTLRTDGLLFNDDRRLEREADAMSAGASGMARGFVTAASAQDDDRGAGDRVRHVPWGASAGDLAAGPHDFRAAIVGRAFHHRGAGFDAPPTVGLPIQRRLHIGGAQITNARTVRHRTAQRADDATLRVLLSWTNDRSNHTFRDWNAAIAAARAGQGPSARTILLFILFSLLLLGGGALFGLPLLLGGRGGSGPRDALEPPRPMGLPRSPIPPALSSTALVPLVRSLDAQHGSLDLAAPSTRSKPRARAGLTQEQTSTALVPFVRSLGEPLSGSSGEAAIGGATSSTSSAEDRRPVASVTREDEHADEEREQILALNRRHLRKNYDLIRVHTHANSFQSGRGHQSAAIAILEQLTRDYPGIVRVELVIHAARDAMHVFDQLLPGIDHNSDHQSTVMNHHNVSVVRHDESTHAKKRPAERVLGIYPADDREIWDDDVTNITATGAMMHDLGSRELIALNPHGWGDPETARFIDTGSMTYPIESSESSIYRGNTYKNSKHRSNISTIVAQNIAMIVKFIKSGQVDLWPWYGLHLWDAVNDNKSSTIASANMMLAASQYNLDRRHKRSRAIIIVNLSKKHPSHTALLKQVQGEVLGGNITLSYADIKSPLKGRFGPNDVVFLDVGPLPKDWFSLVMDHATLPITYEGANTANLAHQLGRPFFSMRPLGSTPYVDIPGFAAGREQLVQAGKNVNHNITPETYKQISAILQALEDPDSEVSKYIRAVLRAARSPKSDQLLMALARLRDVDADRKK